MGIGIAHDNNYWLLAVRGKEVCLNCPLDECILFEQENCHLLKAIPSIRGLAWKEERKRILTKMKMDMPDFSRFLGKKYGIKKGTMNLWLKEGYLIGKRMGREWIITDVDIQLK